MEAKSSDSISELIEQINAIGFLVNNLYQVDNGKWVASLRLGITFEFGEGLSPAEALFNAKRKIFREPLRSNPPPLTTKLTLEDLGL